MTTLFDQEKALEDSFRDVAKDARAEGRVEGIEKGIRALVSTLKEIALAPAEVAQALVKQFNLSQDAAEQKVQQYWS